MSSPSETQNDDNSGTNLDKLIEDEKINNDILNLFKINNDTGIIILDYEEFFIKFVNLFDKNDEFNFYNDIGPFYLILEQIEKNNHSQNNDLNNLISWCH